MSESFQNEIPRARVNIKLDLLTGGVRIWRVTPLSKNTCLRVEYMPPCLTKLI